jgi:Family of unknown function (DUF5335)
LLSILNQRAVRLEPDHPWGCVCAIESTYIGQNYMTTKIDINKSIPQERWLEFFDQFADGNRGRHISILILRGSANEILGAELGDLELIQNAPLMAMVYDPPNQGDKLTIETGKDEVTYAHTVDSPTEVLTGQDANGIMLAVQIRDATGIPTLIKLQSN